MRSRGDGDWEAGRREERGKRGKAKETQGEQKRKKMTSSTTRAPYPSFIHPPPPNNLLFVL